MLSPRTEPAAASRRPWYRILWRYTRATLIFLVVTFHLVVLAIRNPLDLWEKDIRDWMQEWPAWGGLVALAAQDDTPPPPSLYDRYGQEVYAANKFTWKFTNLTGIEQRWVMFAAILIFLLARLLTHTVSLTFRGVAEGRFQLFGIDQVLAEPTRKLVNVIIWLFALAMAYPYLPGSDTDAFKGLSVLVGLMVSLGASGIVGQAAGHTRQP